MLLRKNIIAKHTQLTKKGNCKFGENSVMIMQIEINEIYQFALF